MSNESGNIKVSDGMVVDLDYTLRVDNEVVDTSEGRQPIKFIQGQGYIIDGLEKELYGMKAGEDKQVVIPPERGYGTVNEEAILDVPKDEFPEEIPLQKGTELKVQTQEGETMDARITSVAPDSVQLDFNHPLAGKELHFSVKVNDIREATAEEIAHGHVHGQGGHSH
ncbi:MAG TPA: peptidylprolyl isomerase [Anaerolineales bacterium]